MIRRIPSKFLLEVFDNRLSNQRALIQYLDIYAALISPENRTDSNELIAFLEEPLDDRRIIYFGLKYAGTPCGFAITMLYPKESVFIVDHVAIESGARAKGAFFELVFAISNFLADEGITPDYVIAEIMRRTQSIEGDVDPVQLMRLLRTIGFKSLQIPYVAPHYGIADDAAKYRSTLMIIPRQHQKELPAEECKRLIELIYFNHYMKWYQRAWPEAKFARYRKSLGACFDNVTKRLTSAEFIRLNGAPTEEPFTQTGMASHVSNYTYAALFLGPIVLTLAFSLFQALWLTAAALGVTLVGLLFAFVVPSWRSKLVKFFGAR